MPKPSIIKPLQRALLAWFKHHREDLPWRHTKDPYAIWLSEIMLQQTQVATVVPYYARFLKRFPAVESLAGASLDEVLKLWEGLGYYGRARNLHRAAQKIVAELGGRLPASVDGLRKLPGIGPYTAGAISSLAFGLDVPALDGNVIRVLTRLFDIEDDISHTATRKKLWALAEQMIPKGQAGPWNEALMELGRRICTPRSPKCDTCPLAPYCKAKEFGKQEDLPTRPPRAKSPHHDVTAAIIRREDGQILIARRPFNGLLGGLWEFPGGKREAGETLEECLRREIREELGIEILVGSQMATVKHAYTHFRATIHAFNCQYIGGEPKAIGCEEWAWIRPNEFGAYAFPSADRGLIAMLQEGGAGEVGDRQG